MKIQDADIRRAIEALQAMIDGKIRLRNAHREITFPVIIAALEQQHPCEECKCEAEPRALTVEELREMDGMPIWVVFKGDEYSEALSHWCFVSGGDVYPCDWYSMNDYTYPLNGFGKADTDLCAYDREPKED